MLPWVLSIVSIDSRRKPPGIYLRKSLSVSFRKCSWNSFLKSSINWSYKNSLLKFFRNILPEVCFRKSKILNSFRNFAKHLPRLFFKFPSNSLKTIFQGYLKKNRQSFLEKLLQKLLGISREPFRFFPKLH